MKKEREITRTIARTTVNLVALDVEKGEMLKPTFTVTGKFESDKELLDFIKEEYETESIKIVMIESSFTHDHLYAMSERDFVAYAVEREPRKTNDEN